ncbi:MAG: hypothetical protein AB4062_12820 [Crocosphaera sp.]
MLSRETLYADTLNFDLVGSLELESTFSNDVLLNGSLVDGISKI